MEWQRFGECNQCGECCKGDPYAEHEIEDPHQDCPHLIRGEPGEKTRCEIHGTTDTYWARACSKWPVAPLEYAGCSYTFKLVESERAD